MCRVDTEHAENISAPAACVIPVGNALLTLQLRQATGWQLPGGYAVSGKTAQCSAHQHLWRQTGLNSQVGAYLGTDAQQRRLYYCRLDGGFSGEITHFPVPAWAQSSVAQIHLVNPFELHNQDWHQPDDFKRIRDAYVIAAQQQK